LKIIEYNVARLRLKTLVFTIVVAALALIQIAAAQNTTARNPVRDAAVARQIEQLEEARNQAILKGDAATIEKITSDDYTFITLKAELRTKAEIVKGFASGSFKFQSRTI
jgi:hypothetical protein